MNKTSWIIFSVFTLAILAVLVIFSNHSNTDVSNVDINKVQAANGQDGNIADHVFGKVGSKVILVEYGDYQCSGCGQAYPTFKEMAQTYIDKIQFIFRNFPLTSIHPNALSSAAAAEAAGLQGKYWEMHDALYENQSSWSELNADDRSKFFQNLANSLDLNITKFSSDLITSAINDKINFDTAIGKKAGVNSTPTIYLDGKLVDSSVWSNKTKFKDAINAELKKAGIDLPATAK